MYFYKWGNDGRQDSERGWDMKILKADDMLSVTSHIHFDDNAYFCGRPYVYLSAHKKGNKFWEPYRIGIVICDQDDLDIGLVYKTDEEHFFDVLHELINWMRDHEEGITSYEEILEPFTFFPDLGCEREYW